MICKFCQTENDADAKVCKECGRFIKTGQPDDMTIEEQDFPMAGWEDEAACKPKGGRKWIIAVVAVIVLAAVAAGAYMLFGKPKQETVRPDIEQEAPSDIEEKQEMDKADILPSDESDRHYYESGLSFDQKTEVYVKDDDLYLRIKGEETLIAEDAQLIRSSYTRSMAGSGAALLYEKSDTLDLYYYNCETKETTVVTEGFGWCNLSTNGQYVVYTKEDGIYLWDGESKKLDDGQFKVCSVSDDGLVYTIGHGGEISFEDLQGETVCMAMYSYTKDGTKTLVKDGMDLVGNDFAKNRTQDQILFAAYENEEAASIYVSIDGAPAQKVMEQTNTMWAPTLALSNAPINQAYNDRYYGVYDLDDLRGQIYQVGSVEEGEDTALIFVDDQWNGKTLLGYSRVNPNMFYERSIDNQYIYARKSDGDLCRIDVKTGETEKLLEDVLWFASAGDGSVYYSDESWTLLHLKDGKTSEIAEDVERTYLGTDNGGVLYVGEDGKLWLKQPGEEAELIAENVTMLRRSGKEFVYKQDDAEYCSTDGKTFELR